MTDKDPNDMTASEMVRKAAMRETDEWGNITPQVKLFSALLGEDASVTDYVERGDLLRKLADKIDAEIVKAYSEKLDTCAMRWAKANGWPDFREGEDFGAWLARCTYKKPVDDRNEPVQFGDDIELHYRGGGVDKGCFQEVAINKGPVSILSFVGVSHARDYRYDSECDILKRPVPEVLGADGLPLKVGEVVYSDLYGCEKPPIVSVHRAGECLAYGTPASFDFVRYEDGFDWAYTLTHTPPDTQERIDEDITLSPIEYCADILKLPNFDVMDYSGFVEAMMRDLLRRQRELDKRTGGDA